MNRINIPLFGVILVSIDSWEWELSIATKISANRDISMPFVTIFWFEKIDYFSSILVKNRSYIGRISSNIGRISSYIDQNLIVHWSDFDMLGVVVKLRMSAFQWRQARQNPSNIGSHVLIPIHNRQSASYPFFANLQHTADPCAFSNLFIFCIKGGHHSFHPDRVGRSHRDRRDICALHGPGQLPTVWGETGEKGADEDILLRIG